MVRVNIEECNNNFKSLWKYCAEHGLGIPYLLTNDVPREYKYTREEMDKILKKVSEDKKHNINDYYITQRIKELEIFDKYTDLGKAEEKILDYHEKQLKDFIKEHKQFQNLIEK